MKKMTIVHISYVYVGSFRDPQAWLRRINFFTTILTAMAKHASVKSIHCIGYEGDVHHHGVDYHFFDTGRTSAQFPFRIHDRVKEFDPHAVVVHGLVFPLQVILLRRALGKHVKIFVQHHAEKPLRLYKKHIQAVADRYVDAYFFTAAGLAEPWIKSRQIKASSKVFEVMEVSSVFSAADSNDESRTQRYLWVGRLDDNKDPITLVKGFGKFSEHMPEAKLTIIYRGGSLHREVTDLIQMHNWKTIISLKEDVPHEELSTWYNQSGFILSTSHYEGSGTAVCEGMSCGCIPVVTGIPSFEMMTGKNKIGLSYKAGDSDGLAAALKKTLKMDVRHEREKVLRHFADHLSPDAIALRILKIIEHRIL